MAALQRCIAEGDFHALNQRRYQVWRGSLPDRRAVPNPLAFGDAKQFVRHCKSNAIPFVPARHKAPSTIVFMSNRQLRSVLKRFVSDSPDDCSMSAYQAWRDAQEVNGSPVPSSVTIAKRLGGWRKALSKVLDRPLRDGVERLTSENDRLARVATEVKMVEDAGLLEPSMRAWNELRAARPELGVRAP